MNRQQVRLRADRAKKSLGVMAAAFVLAAAAQLFPELIPTTVWMVALVFLIGSAVVAVANIVSLL